MEWRDVYGFEGLYLVSEFGDVQRIGGSPKCRKTRSVKTRPSKQGYMVATLCKDNKVTTAYVHQMVAAAFLGYQKVGRRKGDVQVNHKNGIKAVNHFSNLEYLSIQGNHDHAAVTGLKASGERNSMSKLKADDILEIRKSVERADILATQYGVHWNQIYRIRRRANWKRLI